MTLNGAWHKVRDDAVLRFMMVAAVFYGLTTFEGSFMAIRQVNARDERPAVFYFHPWEIDPGQPRVANAPLKSRLRHYTNLSGMAGKLEQLIGDFRWGRMDALAAREALRAQVLA